MIQSFTKENQKLNDELSDEDLELVIGGIMSEVVIRETMENIKKLGDKKSQPENQFKN